MEDFIDLRLDLVELFDEIRERLCDLACASNEQDDLNLIFKIDRIVERLR
jgi:hypothetical protein